MRFMGLARREITSGEVFIRDRHAVPTQVLATMVDLEAVESALLGLMNSDGDRTSAALLDDLG